MDSVFEKRLARFSNPEGARLLGSGLIGLEKENLRVGADGHIARTPHPPALGSSLTCPWLTTDYSEALLEYITPPFASLTRALGFLSDVHRFVYEKLADELLWATSMPCVVAGEAGIPIASYGSSNVGTMKTVYRIGLGYRYGKIMQVIAGGHFNYSFPDAFWPLYQSLEGGEGPPDRFRSESYMGLIRNMQRFGWLVSYLFGSSPAVCKSFTNGKPTSLKEFDRNTWYEPWATSLRMSDIGYQNTRGATSGFVVNYNSLPDYIRSLTRATETVSPEYERIGVVVDGHYRQLNANILQIENEYYSSIRPKPLLKGNEKPTVALARGGVQYVELRSLDLNTFEPMGMGEDQLRFLEALMILCLFRSSPPISDDEHRTINDNLFSVAMKGRKRGLQLNRNGEAISLQAWGEAICDELAPVCELLDSVRDDGCYTASLAAQRAAIEDANLTPSARTLEEMRDRREGFFHFAKRISLDYQRYFLERPLPATRRAEFEDDVRESLRRQEEIEASDDCSFEEYLERYFAQ